MIERLQAQSKTAVIPPKRSRATPHEYDKDLYQSPPTELITYEPNSNCSGRLRQATISGQLIFWVRFTLLLL
ncbi:MAG TPA: hypothetical protein V6D43_19400 [Candidatus Sericytochromatia bacterium]